MISTYTLSILFLFIWITSAQPTFFEKQETGTSCQKHAVNNMFQDEVIKDCMTLEQIKTTHGSVYDYLSSLGFTVTDIDLPQLNSAQAIVDAMGAWESPVRLLISVNVYSVGSNGAATKTGSHIEAAIKWDDGKFYELDSENDGPVLIGSAVKLAKWLLAGTQGITKDSGKFVDKFTRVARVTGTAKSFVNPYTPRMYTHEIIILCLLLLSLMCACVCAIVAFLCGGLGGYALNSWSGRQKASGYKKVNVNEMEV